MGDSPESDAESRSVERAFDEAVPAGVVRVVDGQHETVIELKTHRVTQIPGWSPHSQDDLVRQIPRHAVIPAENGPDTVRLVSVAIGHQQSSVPQWEHVLREATYPEALRLRPRPPSIG